MAITNKYELDTTNYGTPGWNALGATCFEKLDDAIQTYIRFPVASGESIAAFTGVRAINGEWKGASSPSNIPAHGIAIEAGVSGEYLRAQCMGIMNGSGEWNFTGSGEVYINTDGTIIETNPGNSQSIGYITSFNTIFITSFSMSTNPYQALFLSSGETSIPVRNIMVETVALTAGAPVSISNITGGYNGMRKTFAFDDSNYTIKHDPSKIILQGSVDSTFSSGDILEMLCRGTFWKEITRSLYA